MVLYVGTLHRDRLDVDLCVTLAGSLRGTATFVLVGPVALEAADQTFLTGSGAVLLGARDHTTIPAYLKNADVLVVPHVVTEFTDSLDPIKVYEYLAAGRRVVSTPVAGFRALEPSQASVTPAADFVASVRQALGDPAGTGPSPGSVPSWEERAAALTTVIRETART